MCNYLNLFDLATSLYSYISKHCVAYLKCTHFLLFNLKIRKGDVNHLTFKKIILFVVVDLKDDSENTPTPKQERTFIHSHRSPGSVHTCHPGQPFFQIFPGLHSNHPSSLLTPPHFCMSLNLCLPGFFISLICFLVP